MTNSFKNNTNNTIFYYYWQSKQYCKGIVQIAHGMGEHAARYKEFALALNQAGFDVYANDHISHGKSPIEGQDIGYYDGSNFWNESVNGMYQLTEIIKEKNPNKKLLLFGHSMGSLFLRDYITIHGKALDAIILSGTGSYKAGLGAIGIFIASMQKLIIGRSKNSNLLKSLFFDDFNKPFKPVRTNYDWLSRNPNEVDKYINDSLVVKNFSLGLMYDILIGLKKVNQKSSFTKIPKDLPIYIFSGGKDPVGEMGTGIKIVFEKMKTSGVKNISMRLYPEARHEMLNEINKKEVIKDVLIWMEDKF